MIIAFPRYLLTYTYILFCFVLLVFDYIKEPLTGLLNIYIFRFIKLFFFNVGIL